MDFGLRPTAAIAGVTREPFVGAVPNPRLAESKSVAGGRADVTRCHTDSYSCDRPHRPIPVRRDAVVFREVRQNDRTTALARGPGVGPTDDQRQAVGGYNAP
jgi:hypothetical protein